MREDPILEFFFKSKEYIVKNANMLLGAGIVVVFIVGFFLIYTQMKKSSQEKARDAFGQAMVEFNNRVLDRAVEDFRVVFENHRGTPEGTMSAYMLGSIFYNIGRYDEAIQWFESAAVKKSSVEFIVGEAMEGIAGCYETKGDITKALEYYQKALGDGRISYRHAAISWKMALLNQKINNNARAKALCQEIIANTSAVDYRQRAENLLAVLEAASG